MKNILIIIFTFLSLTAFSQVKYLQLEKCKIDGVICDSCFRITDANGLLTRCVPLDSLKVIFGGNKIVVQDWFFENDTIVKVQYTNGVENEYNMCDLVHLCEALTSISSKADGSYKYKDEHGDTTIFGYKIECEDDSTLTLKNWQNQIVGTCIIKGGANDLALSDITVEADSTVLLHFTDGSTALLNLNDPVKKYETKTYIDNNSDGSYTYTSEDNVKYKFGYKFNKDSLGIGKIYIIDEDGTKRDSINLCNVNCKLSLTVGDDSYTAPTCINPYQFNVSTNDATCSKGNTVYSWTGISQGGYVVMDADGNGFYYFTDCEPSNPHMFSYQACCSDGTCDDGIVTITLPSCPGTAAANMDMYSGKQGGTIVFSVGTNDVNCGVNQPTTWKIDQLPLHGSIFITEASGVGSYSPMANFVGSDSCIVGIYCNNVKCDTSWLKFKINASNLKDDYIVVLDGKTKSGNNATTNDGTCSVGVTTWAWKDASWFPSGSATSSGNPDNFSVTSTTGFCGISMREYYLKCDGVVTDSAIVYLYHVCGQAFDDEFETSDSNFVASVSGNDIKCSNTGISTWHLNTNPTSHGTGLNVKVFVCDGVGCPTAQDSPSIKIVQWDTLTGSFTIDYPDGFNGEVCFKYYLKCRLTDGSNFIDSACVHVIRVKEAFSTIEITMPDTTVPLFNLKLGAWCNLHYSGKTCLKNNDLVHLRMVTLQGTMDVDLVVGQDITTGPGYTNDVGGRYASWFLPSITSGKTLSAANLCNGNQVIGFRKDTFAKKSNNWGDGSINSNKIGQELYLYFSVKSGSCGGSNNNAVDTIPKLYEVAGMYASTGNNNTCLNPVSAQVFYCVNATAFSPFGQQHNVTASTPAAAFISVERSCDSVSWTTAPFCVLPSYVIGCIPGSGFKFYRNNTNTGYWFPNITSAGIEYMHSDWVTGTQSGLTNNLSWYPFYQYIERNLTTRRVKMTAYQEWNFGICPSNDQDEFWIGNNPGDLASSGSNRTLLLQNITNNTYIFKDHILPSEGKYWTYARNTNTGCRNPYNTQNNYFSLFSF